jgi:sugar phosphate isomerase/epimerase
MRIATGHLTYCTNVHPGESWPEVRRQLGGPVLTVRNGFPATQRFGIGLRLSAAATTSLLEPRAFEELKAFLDEHGLYVFTLNGFPYGTFHGQPVKEAVYQPDWRQPERGHYTTELARVLAALLPPGERGSISTVPGGFKPLLTRPRDVELVAERLLAQAASLYQLKRETGAHITLALEPEPHCLLETTQETVAFFRDYLLTAPALAGLARALQLPGMAQAEAVVRDHLGVCLDTCHAAVEFEGAHETLHALESAGIQIAKVQLSAGLKLNPADDDQLRHLMQYDERVYLHQVVSRSANGELLRFLDLADAMNSAAARSAEEWRVHFHVPIYSAELTHFGSTQDYLKAILARHRQAPVTAHLEVETYTWDVLPEHLRVSSVEGSIERELNWVLEQQSA